MAGAAWSRVLTQKKTVYAKEQHRSDVIAERRLWKTGRMPYLNRAMERLVFIDETSTNTKMLKQTGWSAVGERLVDHVPFGHWKSQTFIAGLRCHSLIAPCVLDHPMNKESFETYVEHYLAPELNKGDVVLLDNLSAHNRAILVLMNSSRRE